VRLARWTAVMQHPAVRKPADGLVSCQAGVRRRVARCRHAGRAV